MSQIPRSEVSRWYCPVCRGTTLGSAVPLCRECYDASGALRVMEPEEGDQL